MDAKNRALSITHGSIGVTASEERGLEISRDGKTVLTDLSATGTNVRAVPSNDDPGAWVRPDYDKCYRRVVAGEMTMDEIPGPPAPGTPLPQVPLTWHAELLRGKSLLLAADSPGGLSITRRVTAVPGEPALYVEVATQLSVPHSVERVEDCYRFAAEEGVLFSWAPQVKLAQEQHFPDWSFKTPAVLLQRGTTTAALVADVDQLQGGELLKKINTALDMDVSNSARLLFTYGLLPSTPEGHSQFAHADGQRTFLPPGSYRFAYYLFIPPSAVQREGYRELVAFLWRRFGTERLRNSAAAQRKTFGEWEREVWHEFAGEAWFQVEGPGPVRGAFQNGIFGRSRDAWFTGWWNNIRTAYGMALYARRSEDRGSASRATAIVELLLSAPRNGALFPVLYFEDESGGHWLPDHEFGGYPECYHSFDMAWTAYWLLRWLQEVDSADPRIPRVCTALGDFLLHNQRPDGFIPSYYTDTLEPRTETRLNQESAEPAVCALFLARLFAVSRDDRYRDGAVRALEYLEREIVPQAKWFDYETFLSCSPKPYEFFCRWTGQHPQNNLATIHAASACLEIYRFTAEDRFIELGTRILDYLSLTQQVWSHPAMTPNLFGGFATQNSDAEWSDARQAYCAETYLNYYDATGSSEYLERGVAALRANFAIGRYENWAHLGFYDGPGALSGFNWGLGSAMTSVELVRDRLGDIFVDAERGTGVGVNGCTLGDLHVADPELRVEVYSPFQWHAPATLVIRGGSQARRRIWVNGTPVGYQPCRQSPSRISIPARLILNRSVEPNETR